ncbi:DUF4244 domain-containing protein [Streptomyces sp. NPDC050315]|uniref:DUF4244 domain-containing protein n=1 Tax=Streptomyces sp. NPDC050315 TaxID=3155039 RepID=UPI00341AE157
MTTAARKPSGQPTTPSEKALDIATRGGQGAAAPSEGRTPVPAWAAAAGSAVREARAGATTAAGEGRDAVTVAGGPAAWAAWAASCLDYRKVTGRLAARRRAGYFRGEWGRRRRAALRQRVDRGMATAEYAMGTLAACAFAAVLFKVVTSGAVSSALSSVIGKALHVQV